MPFWSRRPNRKKQIEQESEEVQRILRDVMSREITEGPEAKPWKQRNAHKPYPEYRPVRWDRWSANVSSEDDTGLLQVPETMIGVVFEDDYIRVNGEWRKVVSVITSEEQPFMLVLSDANIRKVEQIGLDAFWAEIQKT